MAVVAVLLAACGTTGSSAASSARRESPSPTRAASPTPYVPTSTTLTLNVLTTSPPANGPGELATVSCSGAIGASDPVAIVQLHTTGLVMRDYADPAHPRTVCEFRGMTYVPVLDARHVLLSAPDYYYAVLQVPEMAATWFQLPPANNPTLIGISPNLDQIAYLDQDVADGTDKVHLVDTGGDHVIASAPNPHGGRCGSADDSKAGDYQHFGGAFYVLDQPFRSLNSLFVVDNGLVKLSLIPTPQWETGAQPEFPVWSPTSETLYYRQGGDVWRWAAAGGAQKFLPGVSWYYPTVSADGAHLAYSVVRPDGLHNVYLVDLAHGGSPQLIGKGARNLPVFLNSSQLWYRSEGQGICGPGGDQPLVYDVSDGSEAPSIVDGVLSVWPSTSSNF